MNTLLSTLHELGTRRQIDARDTLLRAGDVAQHLYLIEKGCLRLYLIDSNGRETSTQFFFEGDVVSSMESFMSGRPSTLYLESLEPCQLWAVGKNALMSHLQSDPMLQSEMQGFLQQRLIHYAQLYTSAIADSPTQRYRALQAEHQQRTDRIPLNILASYLGVTPVHLSRIRREIKNQLLPAR